MGDEPKRRADETRRLILTRRATFIAAALAGVGCSKEAATPEAPMTQDAPDASTPIGPPPAPNDLADDPSDAGPPPRPCLKVAQPEACLKIAPPRDRK